MTIRRVLFYPDPKLRFHTESVTDFGDSFQTLIDDMLETMYQQNGAGLAAPQIGRKENVVVMDISESRNKPMVLVNAKIIEKRGEVDSPEGCLSFPGIAITVKRSEWVSVEAQDRQGKTLNFETDGFLAICIQHELDHNNGVVFIDHLSSLKRKLELRKMEKAKKVLLKEANAS